jgi:hypothetical protein
MPENVRRAYPLLVVVFTAVLALIEAGAAVEALRMPAELAAQVSVPVALEVIGGVVWALVFAVVTFRLARRDARAGLLTAWALIAFSIYTVARLLLFTQADYDRQRLPFLLVICGGTMLIPVLYLIRAARGAIIARTIAARKTATMEKTNDGRESEN